MISVVMCTARRHPGYKQLADSLHFDGLKIHGGELIIVDEGIWYREKECRQELEEAIAGRFDFQHVAPKPTVWRGPYRLTQRDYWDKQSAINTAVCYARYDRLAFVDDECVVSQPWLGYHAQGHAPNVAICGAYQYWFPGAVVNEFGQIIDGKKHTPGDHRLRDQPTPGPCNPAWLYGGNCSFPLESILTANGWEEALSGSGGLEDSEFSVRISRLCPTYFIPMCVANYLTPDTVETIGDHVGRPTSEMLNIPRPEDLKRCKGFNYKDAQGTIHWFTWNHVPIWWLTSHKLGEHPDKDGTYCAVYDPRYEKHRNRFTTIGNKFNLRQLRNIIQSGGEFPIPTEPKVDWRDKMPLAKM